MRDARKCILCGDCIRMCSEIQGVVVIDFNYRGGSLKVGTAFDRPIAETGCVGCGQYAAVCPTGAIVVKNDVQRVWNAIHDPDTRVIAQIAPAIRVAIGEGEFGAGTNQDVLGRTVAALRRMDPEGIDMPFDLASGAGVIFGVTGGVVESVIRRLLDDKSGDMLRKIARASRRRPYGWAGAKYG